MNFEKSVTRIAQAIYIASDCIARVHDLTSLETACQAVSNVVLILAQTSPEEQQIARDRFEGLSTLGVLLVELKAASATLNHANFAGALAHVS